MSWMKRLALMIGAAEIVTCGANIRAGSFGWAVFNGVVVLACLVTTKPEAKGSA
jgi:hypothetical protein